MFSGSPKIPRAMALTHVSMWIASPDRSMRISTSTHHDGSYRVYVHYYASSSSLNGDVDGLVTVWIRGVEVFAPTAQLRENDVWRVGDVMWYGDEAVFVPYSAGDKVGSEMGVPQETMHQPIGAPQVEVGGMAPKTARARYHLVNGARRSALLPRLTFTYPRSFPALVTSRDSH